ncbi:hypothetical protein QO004_000060 [Rhizobium mesoamericanum]|uniref:hypothetical protein n=1 Tax=Rhizobium mesoamericanum TaxID=1079800 RepID=UPI00278266B4|nr:hypothetical protein [Rhizobium mesoamericanum]MDQ0558287.1 hypothetical protein [Rhizobium mesoamericanum]
MTTHAQVKHSDRTQLPRGLLPRRRRPLNPDYQFAFEIGQTVILDCTGELAIVTGRMQVIDCMDEYVIQLIGVSADPLRVLEYQIRENQKRRTPRNAEAQAAKPLLLLRGPHDPDFPYQQDAA